MGTWGASIFADDFAADIRREWRESIEDDVDPGVATARLIGKYGEPTEEPNEDALFWVALAAAQAQTGRLQPDVKARAIEIIDAGGDIGRWADAGRAKARRRSQVLAELREALTGQQPLPTTLRRPRAIPSPVTIGDLIAVRGTGAREREAYFLVVGIGNAWPRGSTAPELVGLHWTKPERPSAAEARVAPLVRSARGAGRIDRVDVLHVQGPSQGPNAFSNFATVIATGIDRPDAPRPVDGDINSGQVNYRLTLWANLARMVDEDWFSSQRGG